MEKEETSLVHLVATLNPDFEKGLTNQQAEERLRRYGPNILFPDKRRASWAYISFLKEPMVLLLAFAALVYGFLGETLDAIITGAATIPVGLIDVIVNVHTDNALKQLETLREPKVTVIRAGKEVRILSEGIVPGDHLIVKEGELVMADAAITESSDLKVDESPLTGESVPVEKSVQPRYSQEFFGNEGSLFAGTRILMGRANCLVVETGQNTAYGKIGGTLAKTETVKTKLQRDINWVVTRFGAAAVVLSILLTLLELSLGRPLSRAVLSGVSLAIAAIPEELPVVFTLFLTLGMLELARNRALVRKLPAVEALGSVNVVCTDKTGTLTTGKMSVVELFTNKHYTVSEFLATELSPRFILYAMMACEKDPFDYMEQAIYHAAAGTDAPKELSNWTLVKEYPFDEKRKLMSHIWKNSQHGLVLSAKGAVESILSLCILDDTRRQGLLSVNQELGSRGARVLALAYKSLRNITARENDEAGLTLAGLIGFSDPLRAGITQAVTEAQTAGVRVVMLTGDHRSTADAIAHEAGLKHDRVIEGSELQGMNDDNFLETIKENNIFCRVLPEQKLRIVQGLQSLGYSVAVTGDGINDAPALKKADIGIAMGEKGTEVAKEAASMVLLDDNFKTIVSSIRNGRKIYDNVQSAFKYVVAFHVPIFFAALIVPLLKLPLLLVPIDIVLLELVLHPVVSVVFQAQPAEANIMRRGPRDTSAPIVNSRQLFRLVGIGALIFAFSLAAYLWGYANGQTENSARGLALATMIVGQTAIVPVELGGKGLQPSEPREKNKYVMPVILLVLSLLVVILYVPFLADAVNVGSIGLLDWGMVMLFGLATFMFARFTSRNPSRRQ